MTLDPIATATLELADDALVAISTGCPQCGADPFEPCRPSCIALDDIPATEMPWGDCTICGSSLDDSDHATGCPDRGSFNNQR